jgi:uncharacterized protein YjbI with pentapeptide repeats
LSQANLQGADLRGALLGDADLHHADLNGADLSGARYSTQTEGLWDLIPQQLEPFCGVSALQI